MTPQYFPPAAGMEEAGVSLRDFSWLPQREADGDCPPQPPTACRRTIRRSLVVRFPLFRGPRRETNIRKMSRRCQFLFVKTFFAIFAAVLVSTKIQMRRRH